MLIVLPVFLIELSVEDSIINLAKIYPILFYNLYFFIFLGLAFVEEFMKYLVVREKVLKNPEFDEPTDAMLYMIIAALGFAALENILALLPDENPLLLSEAIKISAFRFVGATLLHALASGIVGYYLAVAFFEAKKHLRLVVQGLTIATLLHALFNLLIMRIGENLALEAETGRLIVVNNQSLISSIIILVILLSGMAFFVSVGFRKVKKMASICKTPLKNVE